MRCRPAVLPHFQDELDAFGLEAAAVHRPDAREAGAGGDWHKARGGGEVEPGRCIRIPPRLLQVLWHTP